MDDETRPARFKSYRELDRIQLPPGLTAPRTDAFDALRPITENLRSSVGIDDLARLLYLAGGVVRTAIRENGERAYCRTAMSAGNLHPTELYLVVGDVDGVASGLYHFDPLPFTLTQLSSTDHRSRLAVACGYAAPANAVATIVVTAIPWRQAWKYGERGWRHLYWDTGTVLANLLAAASSSGLRAEVLTGFVDNEVGEPLGLDQNLEFPIAVVPLVDRVDRLRPQAPVSASTPSVPVPASPIVFPLSEAIQRESRLDVAAEVQTWRNVSASEPSRKSSDSALVTGSSIDEVITRRGSTRRMRHDAMPAAKLDPLLRVPAFALDIDVSLTSLGLVTHYVCVHAVEGLEPGAYLLRGRNSIGCGPATTVLCHNVCAMTSDSAVTRL